MKKLFIIISLLAISLFASAQDSDLPKEIIDKNTATNLVNANKDHKGVDLEEADKPELDLSANVTGHVENLYYFENKTAFTSQTIPNSNRYDNSISGVSITEVSPSGEIMSAIVTNPNEEN